jgi:DNA repair exonuclease SbcCD nuclease subunit
MKIAHLSDTHLGARQMHYTYDGGRNIREQDIYDAFVKAVDKILELRPAAVVHAGDLFDGYHPSAAALGVALDQVARLRDADIPIVIISGNHSTPRVAAVDHVFALLERFGGVHAVHTEPRVVAIGEVAVTAIPHCNDRDQLSAWITNAEPSPQHRFNVLVAHVGLDGLGHVGASEAGSVAVSGETLEAVASFGYIALGHLHKFDRPRINAVYAGSLERITWADDARHKGIVEVDLAADPLDGAYVTLHAMDGRKHLRLPEIEALQADNLTDAILCAAQRDDLNGSIVKLPIRDVTVEAFGAIDRRKINTAFKDCLHLELDAHFLDAPSAGTNLAAPQELRDFLSQRAPRGVEPGTFIARAESYISKAAEEIGA